MSVKLLIADDEDSIRNGMMNYVRLHSERIDKIYLAKNGQEALDHIIRWKPDMMILDIQMPVMDGLALMKEASKMEILPKTIILSGYDDFKYAQQAIRCGVEEYLLKPCRSTEIMSLLNKMIDQMFGKEKRLSNTAENVNHIVNSAIEYMNEHYNDNINLTDVADKVGITSGYLSTLFSQNIESGFVDYLNEIRVENACKYLQQYQLKTYEIAFKVGFRDEKYFSKVFKKVKGMAPSEFRKNCQKQEKE